MTHKDQDHDPGSGFVGQFSGGVKIAGEWKMGEGDLAEQKGWNMIM
jgi:hypothetical protein